jgi:hypothetical protein
VSLFTHLWVANGSEDSTLHDDVWRVFSSVISDLQQAVHRPERALTHTSTSTYAALVLAYSQRPGARGAFHPMIPEKRSAWRVCK